MVCASAGIGLVLFLSIKLWIYTIELFLKSLRLTGLFKDFMVDRMFSNKTKMRIQK
jgi:hypothetical protein